MQIKYRELFYYWSPHIKYIKVYKALRNSVMNAAQELQHSQTDHLNTCKWYSFIEVFCKNCKGPPWLMTLFNLLQFLHRFRVEKYSLSLLVLVARGVLIIRLILGPIFNSQQLRKLKCPGNLFSIYRQLGNTWFLISWLHFIVFNWNPACVFSTYYLHNHFLFAMEMILKLFFDTREEFTRPHCTKAWIVQLSFVKRNCYQSNCRGHLQDSS